jgi:threonine aldolase
VPFADGSSDFRSDTVTRPTPEMRQAMAEAEVGDDVYSDDPTANLLEEEAAAAVGKEAAVFTPTGTMGNQLAILLQSRPGDDVLCDEGAHCRNVERGAAAAWSGVSFRTIPAAGGAMSADQIEAALSAAGSFFPRIRLMVWENTHNLSGGRVVPLGTISAGTEVARRHGLAVHLDGARIFNAEAATGTPAKEFAALADTIQFCFSKGLGAPIGSVLCGDADAMKEVRYLRKRQGGGMRQVGVIAAAARIALRDRARLVEDHATATRLGQGLAELFPGSVDQSTVETNMVNVDPGKLGIPFPLVAERLGAAGIKVNPPFTGAWRLVTHRDVDAGDVDRLLKELAAIKER